MTNHHLKAAWILIIMVILLSFISVGLGCGSSGKKSTADENQDEKASAEEAVKETADKFFQAINDLDAEVLAAIFDPDEVSDYEKETGQTFQSLMEKYFFSAGEPTYFKALKYDVDIDGEEASLKVIRGEISYMGADGKEVTENITRDDDISLELVRIGRKWYISMSSFPDLTTGVASNLSPDASHSTIPQPSIRPQPGPSYVACRTCGGTGYISCSDCNGLGGYYGQIEETCPDCGGAGIFTCWNCDGAGSVEGGDGLYTCDICYGTGYTYCDTCGETGIIYTEVWEACPTCDGAGYLGCPTCGASGWVRK